MVFPEANPFPVSIYERCLRPRIHGLAKRKTEMDQIVESSLKRRRSGTRSRTLQEPGHRPFRGQQQRLCIARAIAVSPKDPDGRPCSALDPIATARVEELIDELRQNYTIVIVTHSMQQAARVFAAHGDVPPRLSGRGGRHDKMFTNPDDKRTQDYITGRFG